MIPAEHSLFGGGPLPPKLSEFQIESKRLRDERWNSVASIREQMTEQEKQDEEEKLQAQAAAILAERQRAA
ncbi:hypothetical protein [Ruegeria sp. A3M17]|uniref:hypothetical protein n=1 Tax=Ruegeria sp. A3M17 TaxID=2267229 RepID=UPI000DE9BEC8|nr:hypothetical protein [Ruegeria sp. A3M17]RBW58713.1 hypothetical protein DS906_07880 [Ruegeria sp. A3M17]